jgi:hypothetical protein
VNDHKATPVVKVTNKLQRGNDCEFRIAQPLGKDAEIIQLDIGAHAIRRSVFALAIGASSQDPRDMGPVATFWSSLGLDSDEFFNQLPVDRPVVARIPQSKALQLVRCSFALFSLELCRLPTRWGELVLRKVEIVEAHNRPDMAKIVGFDNTVLGAVVGEAKSRMVCSDTRIENRPGNLVALYLKQGPGSVSFDRLDGFFECRHRSTVERNLPDARFLPISPWNALDSFRERYQLVDDLAGIF